jgi:hypothetical protein
MRISSRLIKIHHFLIRLIGIFPQLHIFGSFFISTFSSKIGFSPEKGNFHG